MTNRSTTLDRARAVLVLCGLAGVGALVTSASWTGAQLSTAEFSAGSFSLVSRTDTGEFRSHDERDAVVLAWQAAPMFPGETRAAWIQVQGAGSVDGSVQLTDVAFNDPIAAGSNDEALRDAMTLRVAAWSDAEAGDPVCDETTAGEEVGGLNSLPALTPIALERQGANTATYCLVVSLPADAPAAAQGGMIAPVWVFGTAA